MVINFRVQLDEGQETVKHPFFTDLANLQLSEGQNTSWLQATPIGLFKHPVYGDLDFRPPALREFEKNFRENVRGQQLNIDFGHESFRDDAAGWVQDIEIRTSESDSKNNGLWYLVRWTPNGITSLSDEAYRYFSIDFATIWKDPTGKVFKNVLQGGALTNRPYMKGMAPVTLTELIQNERHIMDRAALEALAKSLGVEFTESTNDDDLQKLVSDAAIASAAGSSDDDTDGDDDTSDNSDDETQSETDPVLATLSEKQKNDPVIVALLAERKATAVRLAQLEVNARLSEISVKLTDLRPTKGFALAPKSETKLKEIMLSVPAKVGDQVYNLVKSLLSDGGMIELGEIGGIGSKPTSGAQASDEFETLAQKKLSENDKMSYADAVELVASERPELYDAYLTATMGGN